MAKLYTQAEFDEAIKRAVAEVSKEERESIDVAHDMIHSSLSFLAQSEKWEDLQHMQNLLNRLNKTAMNRYPDIQLPSTLPLLNTWAKEDSLLAQGAAPYVPETSCWLCTRRNV